jgi:hypothetical protein
MQSVLWAFAAATVFVPSGEEPGEDFRGFRPVYYPKGDVQMLAVFTTPDRSESVTDIAPWMVTFSGEELLRRMPASDGMVVNPGSELGFDIAPDGLAAFRQELGL